MMSSDTDTDTDTDTDADTGIFPNEIIAEILTRLPAKFICRSKSVSKTWNSIISSPHFISFYISHTSPSWLFMERVIRFYTESTHNPTRFNLLERPKVSSLSANPYCFTPDPITDPNYKNCPAIILGSSNGLLLCGFLKKDPVEFPLLSQSIEQNALIVVNPITNNWVLLPQVSPQIICKRPAVGFSSMVDSCGVVQSFIIVEYQPLIRSDYAKLLCYSSNTRKWEAKDANFMLGDQLWRNDGVFEFAGRLVWFDLSCGIIVWDEDDPFHCVENNDKAVFRFISLPDECVTYYGTIGLEDERSFFPSREWIQYMEVLNEGDYVFKVWRLKDYDQGWSFVYNVSRRELLSSLPYRFKISWYKACFLHPFEGDTSFFVTGLKTTRSKTFSFCFRTRKAKACGSFDGHKFVMPFVIPSWPSSLPPRLCADHAKEKGNEFYKDKKFMEAIRSYTRSIVLYPNAFAYANRALAYLKLNMFKEAEVDCTEALHLDGKYVKVYGRRATAKKEQGNLKGSMEDLEYALKLEPKNQELRKQYTEIKYLFGMAS